jgi:putative ABC transport system ATP-binding protein
MIEVSNVVKTYGKGANAYTALNGVTFTVPDGAMVAIVGKSGSGKSTLMHVMSGLDHATSGEVIVNGKNLKAMKRKELDLFRSTEMSFIFQSFFVQGNDICHDNVALPLEIAQAPRKERAKRVREALEGVELSDKEKSKAKNLSGGQKQRLAIARAIAGRPKILFADEPTGNLDSVTGEVVERLLFDYARNNGATLIVVTHDHDLAARCQMQIHIKDGSIERIEGALVEEGASR